MVLFFLSKSSPLRWASIWFFSGFANSALLRRLFIVLQSETIKSAVIGGCRASGEPMGFKSKNSCAATIFIKKRHPPAPLLLLFRQRSRGVRTAAFRSVSAKRVNCAERGCSSFQNQSGSFDFDSGCISVCRCCFFRNAQMLSLLTLSRLCFYMALSDVLLYQAFRSAAAF